MLGSTQSDVSKLERRSDARLSTLSSYVAVLGGVLEVRARFGTLAIRIGFPEEPSARAIPPTSDRRRGITPGESVLLPETGPRRKHVPARQ
jgi:hypothetical protein